MSVLERAAPARKGGTIMWAYDSVFLSDLYPGLLRLPGQERGCAGPPSAKVADWIPHIRRIHADAVYFTPVFDSDAHGYDTRDYTRIDGRLGTNGEFAALCRTLHESGIRVVLDGVFNHVGRGFWAFQDLLKNREASPYRDWFFVRFDGNNGYDDGLWYEGWEGHDELVKLNLRNEEVAGHLLGCVEGWIREFGIDGLRLDVAYSLEPDFIRRLRRLCDALKPDFFPGGGDAPRGLQAAGLRRDAPQRDQLRVLQGSAFQPQFGQSVRDRAFAPASVRPRALDGIQRAASV